MSLPHPSTITQARLSRGAGVRPSVVLLLFTLFSLFILISSTPAHSADLSLKDQSHLRRPVAAAWIEPDKLLAVANRCGSISLVDVQKRKVVDEFQIGDRLANVAVHPGRNWLFAVDEKRHELILMDRNSTTPAVAQRVPVSPYPVSIAIRSDGQQVAVASLWSRKLTILRLQQNISADDARLNKSSELALPFNPRGLVFVDHTRLLVRDAFRTQLAAIVDLTTSIVGPLENLDHVGESALRSDVLTRQPDDTIRVPAHGGDIRLGPQSPSTGGMAAPASDTGGYGGGFGSMPGMPGWQLRHPADRGEVLFYNRSWGWRGPGRSCHTCHVDGHTSYELSDTLADGTAGTPKRIPTLLGTRLSDPWAWNGKFRDLTEQVRSSLETTMHVKDFTTEQVADITAFLHTLPPPPPLEPATDDPADKAQLARGSELFKTLGCAKCHVPPLTYTSPDTYDVGLHDEKGLTKFNPPSLRGVSQGYSFFHDGRAKSLEEVFTIHGHQLDRALSEAELSDLLRFLRSL
jgi:hypothetical protein